MEDFAHDHVEILAGHAEDGAPVLEQIPVRRVADGLYEVLATPGLAYGCAAGDEVSVDADGRFEVKVHGGNVAIHIYCGGTMDQESLARLRHRFSTLNGTVEAPTPATFAVVTVPVNAGFQQIEDAISGWTASQNDVEWNYGNVYDEDENPLNWW